MTPANDLYLSQILPATTIAVAVNANMESPIRQTISHNGLRRDTITSTATEGSASETLWLIFNQASCSDTTLSQSNAGLPCRVMVSTRPSTLTPSLHQPSQGKWLSPAVCSVGSRTFWPYTFLALPFWPHLKNFVSRARTVSFLALLFSQTFFFLGPCMEMETFI